MINIFHFLKGKFAGTGKIAGKIVNYLWEIAGKSHENRRKIAGKY